MKKSKIYYKQTPLKAVKGADVAPDILAKINKFAQTTLKEEDVYIQKYIMAHNGVDRDRERFPEDLLDDYARTLPGKSFLEAHDKSKLPIGLYFDSDTEKMTEAEFKVLTGEDIRLPEGMDTAKVVYGWIYTLRKDWNQKLIDNLEGGIYRHASIGFSATDLKPVKGEFDQILYWEYMAPGESREGSIVYLGAQQGAIVQKDPDIQDYKSAQEQIEEGEKLQTLNTWLKTTRKTDKTNSKNESGILPDENNRKGGKESMEKLKELLEKLSKEFKTHFTEENIVDEIKSMVSDAGTKAADELTKKEGEIKNFKKQITDLTPLAADGKAFREELVSENIRMKAALGDIAEKEEDQKSVKAVVEKHPIDYLKNENKSLQKRMEEKFDDKGNLKGDANRDKSDGTDKEMTIVPKEDKK
ncbi:MAG: hypothetical protein GY774_16550 [Planctomycetes bacterium]|nr:hypothetical protein [Planctomycetota bacterium]